MIVPLLLVLISTLAAGIIAFGTHPNWAQFSHGLDMIYISRRLQWPMVALCMILCIVLMGLVISGKRRAWWLIGLGPILAMFVYRFSGSSMDAFSVVENPEFTVATHAGNVRDTDYVVGLKFADQYYAYPYAGLYKSPVIFQTDRTDRMLLMWSAFADRATAVRISNELRRRDVEIVSMPANALLLYNSRLGEFINALTLQTRDGQKPVGLGNTIATYKMTWLQWRTLHPNTRIMQYAPVSLASAPTGPIQPYYKLPVTAPDDNEPVALLQTPIPLAIPDKLIQDLPLNLMAGDVPVLLFRDKQTGQLRAFDRRLEDDLVPRFMPNSDVRRKNVALLDSDTTVGWNIEGRALDGDPTFKGRQLTEIPVEDHLYLGVLRNWYPNLLCPESALPMPTAPPVMQAPPTSGGRQRSRQSTPSR